VSGYRILLIDKDPLTTEYLTQKFSEEDFHSPEGIDIISLSSKGGVEISSLFANIVNFINRSVSLEGLSKSEVEQELDLVIPLAVPYMGRDFSLANNLNVPIGDKFPQDAVTIFLRKDGEEITRIIEANSIKKFDDFF